MTTVVIVIHLMVVLAMIGLVLLQRSEGGALGIGGGSGAFMTGRGAANVLTRATAVLAVAFFATSLGLALLARIESRPSDILDVPGAAAPATDETAPAPALGGAPESAQDVLDALGGGEPATEAPPADAGDPTTAPTDSELPPTEEPPAAPAPAQ